mgnify:CR=1 FL=1
MHSIRKSDRNMDIKIDFLRLKLLLSHAFYKKNVKSELVQLKPDERKFAQTQNYVIKSDKFYFLTEKGQSFINNNKVYEEAKNIYEAVNTIKKVKTAKKVNTIKKTTVKLRDPIKMKAYTKTYNLKHKEKFHAHYLSVKDTPEYKKWKREVAKEYYHMHKTEMQDKARLRYQAKSKTS